MQTLCIQYIWKIRESTLVLLNLVLKFTLVLKVKEKKAVQWDWILHKTVSDMETKCM